MTRIAIVSDAWTPQVNGVVRTLSSLSDVLASRGVAVDVVGPDRFRSIPCPTYPEIRLSMATPAMVGAHVEASGADSMHVATEGPLGIAARAWAMRSGMRFTTSFHTRFPEYLSRRLPVPERWTWAALRRFHSAGSACLVPTDGLRRELVSRGFGNVHTWTRGTNARLFRPMEGVSLGLPGPVFLCVSRVAPEKGLDRFLSLDLPGTKVLVGDGPMLPEMRRRYPGVVFAGRVEGDELARWYAGADVFVFPSTTDTFGIVMIEAMACGTPVAALPVDGPIDVVGRGGVLDEDLRIACLSALSVPRASAVERAKRFTWEACADIFMTTLVPLGDRAEWTETGMRESWGIRGLRT